MSQDKYKNLDGQELINEYYHATICSADWWGCQNKEKREEAHRDAQKAEEEIQRRLDLLDRIKTEHSSFYNALEKYP